MAACLACGGCLVVATVAAAGAVVSTTVKTTGKVAGAAVSTTGRVASAVISSPRPPAALTVDSASALSRPDRVVVVENGTATNLPWQPGMTLAAAVPAGPHGGAGAVSIFRGGHVWPADLRQAWTADLALQSGDVVELRR